MQTAMIIWKDLNKAHTRASKYKSIKEISDGTDNNQITNNRVLETSKYKLTSGELNISEDKIYNRIINCFSTYLNYVIYKRIIYYQLPWIRMRQFKINNNKAIRHAG